MGSIEFFDRSVKKYGRLHRIQLGRKEIVCIHSAENLEQMLLKDAKSYSKSERAKEVTYPLLGDFLGTTTDMDYWSQLRQILLPLFTPKMLQGYFDGTVAAINQELRQLESAALESREIELNQFVREGVFLALANTLFTRGLAAEEIPAFMADYTKIAPYMAARYLLGGSPLVEVMPKFRGGKLALKRVNKRIDELIENRLKETLDGPQDMLDVIVMSRDPEGNPLPRDAIRHNVMGLFFGGQETTPGTIMWALGLLAANPDKRKMFLQEIDTVLEGKAPTYQDLSKLKYTEMVINETLRLYPMFPYVEREAKADTTMDGYSIDKGTTLYVVASTTQRDPRFWPDPDRFIPERHTKEEKKKRPRCAMVPFGYGQRRCIGERVGRLEAVLTLAMFSQHFLLDHVDGVLPATQMLMSPKPHGGMRMNVLRRG